MSDEKMVVATLRVTPAMRDWMKGAGSEVVRAAILAAMDGVIRHGEAALSTGGRQPEVVSDKVVEAAPVVEEARNTPVKSARVTRRKVANAEPVVIQPEEPRKPAIPVNLAEQVAAIAARKEAQKKAREGLSDTGRLLSQFRK